MSNPLKKVEHAVTGGIGKIERSADQQIHRISSAGEKAEEHLKEVVKQIASAPFRLAAREALTLAVHLIEEKPPNSYDLRVGPVKMEIHDVRERIDTMKHWRDHPPRHAADIREMIKTLAPTRVHIQTSLSLPVSDVLSIGFRADWTTEEFLSVYDRLMKLIGV